MTYQRSDVATKAWDVKVRAEVLGIFPVPVETIANKLEYLVQYFSPNDTTRGVAGAVSYDKKRIYLNDQASPQRQMFVCAYEIAHIVLHFDGAGAAADADKEFVDLRETIDEGSLSEPRAREAYWFAAILLMPREAFAQKWRELGGDLIEVARYFGVPDAVASRRAQEIGLTE